MDSNRENALSVALRVMFTRPSLALMMFLQYAIWGVWAVALSGLLTERFKFEGQSLTILFNALYFMSLLAPITAGQVADRFMPAQRALFLFHLLGGIVMFVMASQTGLWALTGCMLLYSLFYAPTLALSNSVALKNLSDPDREFGPIRVWGTIGWIAANFGLTFARTQFDSLDWQVLDVFIFAGALSIVMAFACLLLPNTPPSQESKDPLAFTKAFKLFKNPSYLAFYIVALIVATELPLYYILTFPFLQSMIEGATDSGNALSLGRLSLTKENLSGWMNVAQIAEIFTMVFLLPIAMEKWGIRKTLLVGILAWPLRYLAFAFAWSQFQENTSFIWLSIAALSLHGFCYVFFFTVAFIYTDKVAPPDIRSSAQGLINVAVLGIGMLIGGVFAGWLQGYATQDGVTNYTLVFAVPAVITVFAAVFLLAFFKEGRATVSEG